MATLLDLGSDNSLKVKGSSEKSSKGDDGETKCILKGESHKDMPFVLRCRSIISR